MNRIPQVDKVLRHPLLVELADTIRRDVITDLVRRELDRIRAEISTGAAIPTLDQLAQTIVMRASNITSPALNRLINATGVILNTNLGRAPLAKSVLDHLSEVAAGYCNLEFDLEAGKRGERSRNIETLLSLLTGCEAGIVVNNNAAAVLLAVSTLARNRQVLVSRGELIEIGGSFRVPDVIVSAGGTLVEVGTTNRTRLADFQRAITPETGLMLRCHRSNFEIVGFTEEVSLEELVELSRKTGVPVLDDLGSGALIDLAAFGFAGEPTVQSQISAGADLVSFSGDKLLGGPQAGIIVGKRKTVDLLHKSPLYRALRPDKLTLAAVELVLTQYLLAHPESQIPVLKMAHTPVDELKSRAEALAQKVNALLKNIRLNPVATESAAGGGSLPGKTMPSFGVAVDSKAKPNQMSTYLRRNHPPIISVVQEDRTILDLRTVAPEDEQVIVEALQKIEQMISR